MMKISFTDAFNDILLEKYNKPMSELAPFELYDVAASAANAVIKTIEKRKKGERRAAYFSAEFLTGSLLLSNLQNIGALEEAKALFRAGGRSLDELSFVPDNAFGNGGLGRLAACFLESAATCGLNLDGYGIRYDYGLFRQKIENFKQVEEPDDWARFSDSFGVRKDAEKVLVSFGDMSVVAVPYDYYIPGYLGEKVNRLRLYGCESTQKVSFGAFERGEFLSAFEKDNKARAITAFLYPNDSSKEGRQLRLRQQYFFTSAALQNILSEVSDAEALPRLVAIQLNDTHPTIAVAELIRLLEERGESFETAFLVAQKVFSYTNHTVMSEALEKWDVSMFSALLPRVMTVIEKLNERLVLELEKRTDRLDDCRIIKDGVIYMANLACYVCSHINGVAKLHSSIIERQTLSQWYSLYPERFSNKTNGITFRRWLALSNNELYEYIRSLVGADPVVETDSLKKLASFRENDEVLSRLFEIRQRNKVRLCKFLKESEGIELESESVFFVQIKRIHEYKRQLLCALGCLYLYRRMKEEKLLSLPKLTFVFSGKAASSYKEAKLVIEFINRLAFLVNEDAALENRLRIAFVSDYNVSKAQLLIPAADYSLQLSLAGTEASGTGNMKFMLCGAPTIGTFDGANIEIVELAGEENNYIFGLREEEVAAASEFYDPKELCEASKTVFRVVEDLELESGENRECFQKIKALLLNHDRYMVLADFESYIETVQKAAEDYKNRREYFQKSLLNTASASFFSSDRAVKEYAADIWKL